MSTNRIRVLLVSLLAVFAVSAVAASAAQATEGPFYKIEGQPGTERLELLENARTEAGNSETNQVLKAGTITVTCTEVKVNTGVINPALFTGSTGKNASGSLEIVEYSGCTVTGNGANCKVVGGTITTRLLKNTLGYETNTRTGKILTIFEPVSGTEFAEIKFEPAPPECGVASTKVKVKAGKNGVIAENQNEATHEAIEVNGVGGHAEAKAEVGDISFSGTSPGAISVENEGVLTTRTGAAGATGAGLEAFGVAATLTGDTDVFLVKEGTNPRKRWGVFTK